MKKLSKIILICVCVFAAVYLMESIYLGMLVNSAVAESYNRYGEDNPNPGTVPDPMYNQMCYRIGYPLSSQNTPGTREVNLRSFPLVLHWFIGGEAFYRYSYEIYDQRGELQGGSGYIPVTVYLAWLHGSWVFTDYHEPP